MIDSLTKECDKYGRTEDFLSVLVRANRSLCRKQLGTKIRQTAEISSTLRKDLYFGDFEMLLSDGMKFDLDGRFSPEDVLYLAQQSADARKGSLSL